MLTFYYHTREGQLSSADIKRFKKTCITCGTLFETTRQCTKYCSACSGRGLTKVCKTCGAQFITIRSAQSRCTACIAQRRKPCKSFTCSSCGDKCISVKFRKYCDKCLRARAVQQSLNWQCRKNPNKKRGVGSGGAQWGKDNHQWKPEDEHKSTKYHGNYRVRCSKHWDTTRCASCGTDTGCMHIHHVNGDPDDVSPENLVPLCVACHIYRVHYKKWKTAEEYIEATCSILPKECRSKIAELSGKAVKLIRTEGCESSQGQSIGG